MNGDSTLSCCPCRARGVGVDAKLFGSPPLRVFATEEAARVFEDLRVRWYVFWHGPVHGFVLPRDDPESPAFCGAYDALARSGLHAADWQRPE